MAFHFTCTCPSSNTVCSCAPICELTLLFLFNFTLKSIFFLNMRHFYAILNYSALLHQVEVWSAQSIPSDREPETSSEDAVSSFTGCQDGSIWMYFKPGQGENENAVLKGHGWNITSLFWDLQPRKMKKHTLKKKEKKSHLTFQVSLSFSFLRIVVSSCKWTESHECEQKWEDSNNLWCALVWLHLPPGLPWHPECVTTGTGSVHRR